MQNQNICKQHKKARCPTNGVIQYKLPMHKAY